MTYTTRFLSALLVSSQILACSPIVVWYGHSPDRLIPVQLLEYRRKQYVTLDRQQHQRYDGVALESLVFSPDSRHLAYAARNGTRWTVVNDGIAGDFFDGIGQVVFSPDSRRLVFAAMKGFQWHVVEGTRMGPSFDALLSNSLIFSPDSRHLAYGVEHHGSVHVVLDEQMGPELDAVAGIRFSPNSIRMAYVAKHREHYLLVNGDFVGPPYEAISEFVFSPNGNRLAYSAKQAQNWLVVVDGIAGPAFEAAGGLTFSPDSGLLVYVGRRNGRDRVVYPKHEGLDYHHIDHETLSFDPDGHHLAYQAHGREGVFMVLDEKESPAFDQIDGPVFSLKGGHCGYIAWKNDRARVIIDSVKGPEFFWAGDLVFSPDGKRFAYLVRESGQMAVILNQGQRVSFEMVMEGTLMFSSDSLHWACLAGSMKTRQMYLYLDGKQQERSFDWGELAALLAKIAASTLTPELGSRIIHDWVEADMKIILRQMNP